jgi:hypothetical protein
MKWECEINKTFLVIELRYLKIDQGKYFLIRCEYCKQAQKVGDLEKYKSNTIGLIYNNKRIKIVTHQQQTINELID